MRFRRTACAGGLLALDGKQFLMDGVCREVSPYPATPPDIRQELMSFPADALLITHSHEDHYCEAFVSRYCKNTAGPVLGPADIPYGELLPQKVGTVEILPLPSRHIGNVQNCEHCSFILRGSQCVWFLGDSSPLFWKHRPELPKPDVMVVPYAYGIGSGWELCKQLGAKAVVLLHLPERDKDIYSLWDAVEKDAVNGPRLYIPKLGDEIEM